MNSVSLTRRFSSTPYRFSHGSAGALKSTSARHTSSTDTVSLSSRPESHNYKKMGVLAGVGIAVGVAAAAVLAPALGVGALLLGGVVGGVAGAAVGDGALEPHEIRPSEPFDPYDFNDVLDPDKMFHPQNPYNPANWG